LFIKKLAFDGFYPLLVVLKNRFLLLFKKTKSIFVVFKIPVCLYSLFFYRLWCRVDKPRSGWSIFEFCSILKITGIQDTEKKLFDWVLFHFKNKEEFKIAFQSLYDHVAKEKRKRMPQYPRKKAN